MIYITQLIYIISGQEKVFDEFEDIAIPAIARYHGRLLFRMRPGPDTIIDGGMEMPYEVHLVSFEKQDDFTSFMTDPDRQKFLHLKEQSIRSSMLIREKKFDPALP